MSDLPPPPLGRRDFLRIASAGIVGAWAAISLRALGKSAHAVVRSGGVDLELPGVTKPFSFVHLTDAHLTEYDARDETLRDYLDKRSVVFGGDLLAKAQAVFDATGGLQPDFVAFTGDLVDVPTARNLEAAASMFAAVGVPCLFSMGNHEWQEPAEPADNVYWRQRMQSVVAGPMDFAVYEVNGVNLMFVDNSNYQVTDAQLERTSAVIKTGRPCLLFVHIPIAIASLLPDVVQFWKKPIVVGCDDGPYPPTTATRQFCSLVTSSPEVAAIFAGHVHMDHSDVYGGGRVQYVGRPVFAGGMRRVSVRPSNGV